MGLRDSIRGLFSDSRNNQMAEPRVNEEYEKSRLANSIVNLVDQIKRKNSFDSILWNLSNVSPYDLQRKSLNELQNLNSNLENRLSELNRQRSTSNSSKEALEAAKWTGQKPKDMSDRDFDRLQRQDER